MKCAGAERSYLRLDVLFWNEFPAAKEIIFAKIKEM